MIRKSIHTICEIEEIMKPFVLEHINDSKESFDIEVNDEKIYALSDRYKLFFTKGYTCVNCGIAGDHFALERFNDNKRFHLNLYAVDQVGNEILMTKDHIIPKSLGGENNLDNYQVMCQCCNVKKGCRYPGQLVVNDLQQDISMNLPFHIGSKAYVIKTIRGGSYVYKSKTIVGVYIRKAGTSVLFLDGTQSRMGQYKQTLFFNEDEAAERIKHLNKGVKLYE